MDLKALLTELRDNILHDRSDQFEGTSDRLWSDASLINYINEAQRRFARRSLILRDGTTPDVTRITLVNGQNIYPLHEAVFAVLSAKVVGQVADLARAGHAALDTYRMPDTYYFDPGSLSTVPPGMPRAFSTDEDLALDGDGSASVIDLRIYPVPDSVAAGKVVQLRVVRYPIEDLSLDQLSAVPEIPRDHHLEMLDWAAYLALRIVDVDAGLNDRAEKFAQTFEAHVVAARNAVMRKLFTPASWGFGRNGFSWTTN